MINERFPILLGGVIGDIIGSEYEFESCKDYNFEAFRKGSDFTDDTILMCAAAESILRGTDPSLLYQHYAIKYNNPKGAYGSGFLNWVYSNGFPVSSKGNGSAMRVAPAAYSSGILDNCLSTATKLTLGTHNHWQSFRGAHAVTYAIFNLRRGVDKDIIFKKLTEEYYPELYYIADDCYENISKHYEYSELVEYTVPYAIYCAFCSESFEDAIRKAVALGGDADTLACITGCIAECIYQIPNSWAQKAISILNAGEGGSYLYSIIKRFDKKYKSMIKQ